MMGSLIKRAEEIARIRQRAKVAAVAAKLREALGETAVSVEEARVIVRGRGIVRRWLTDPALRFLCGRMA